MNFDELLQKESELLESIDDYLEEFILDSMSDEEMEDIKEHLNIVEEGDDISDEDVVRIEEELRKRVTSKGAVSRVRSRKQRQRRATSTTGMSRTALRRRARRAAKTRKKRPGDVRKALRKRNRALRKRRNMGLKSNR